MYTIAQKEQLIFVLWHSHTPEKVLTKNIRRVRDLEDRILCPRAKTTYAFLAITIFSDI